MGFRFYIARSPHQVREERGPGLSGFFVARIVRSGGLYFTDNANNQSAYSERTKEGLGEIKITGPEKLSATPWRLYASDDANAEEAELCLAQSGKG